MDKVPLEVGKGYVVALPKEASVKVKRYIFNCMTLDEADNAPTYVLATDYDSLLALARRLRAAWAVFVEPDSEPWEQLFRDSAWLDLAGR